jgi:hypothetical protein
MVANWFWNQETYDYIGTRLQYLPGLSVRLYENAYAWMLGGLNWKDLIMQRHAVGEAERRLIDLESENIPVEDRAEIWMSEMQQAGLPSSRASYYNYKKRLLQHPLERVQKIKVRGTRPTRYEKA